LSELDEVDAAPAKKKGRQPRGGGPFIISIWPDGAHRLSTGARKPKKGAYLYAIAFSNGLVGWIFFDFFKVFLAMLFSHT
ncbi:MAG: hypothetical protein WB990_04750, partial [Candidatus Acidiferrales bacterium]